MEHFESRILAVSFGNNMSKLIKICFVLMDEFQSIQFDLVIQQESAITNMENRNYFSLYCIQMETQLIHSNMMMLHSALLQMANVESSSYSEVGSASNLQEYAVQIGQHLHVC